MATRLTRHPGFLGRDGKEVASVDVPVWRPIADIEGDLISYRDPELEALIPVWKDLRRELEGTEALATFNERLARSWAVETGILERIYAVDRGITNLLIEKGFRAELVAHGSVDRSPEELVEMLNAHKDALEGLFAFVSGERPLGTSFIKELLVALTRAQGSVEGVDPSGRLVEAPLRRGEWKALPNNPWRDDGTRYVYCPPEQVEAEIGRLLDFHARHGHVSAEVRSAWMHHRFTQIHPFQDGNGRVARALATLEFLKDHLLPPVVDRDDRPVYISALERADAGDLRPLVDLLSLIERKALLRAMSLAEVTLHEAANMRASAQSLARHLRTSFEAPEEALRRAGGVAQGLQEIAHERLSAAQRELQAQFAAVGVEVQVGTTRSDETTAHYYQWQIVQVARHFDYFAHTRAPRLWTRLHLRDHFRIDLIVSLHAVGRSPRGAMACTAFINQRLERQEDADPEWGVLPACDAPFAFSHASDAQLLRPSFEAWLDRCVTLGLDLIRGSI